MEVNRVGKYNKEKQIQGTKLADHKRVCRVCHMVTNMWYHCGQNTARFAMDLKRPEFVSSSQSTKEVTQK